MVVAVIVACIVQYQLLIPCMTVWHLHGPGQHGAGWLQVLPSPALPAAPANVSSRRRVATSSAPAAAPSGTNAPDRQAEPILLLPFSICIGQQVPINGLHTGGSGKPPAACQHTFMQNKCLVWCIPSSIQTGRASVSRHKGGVQGCVHSMKGQSTTRGEGCIDTKVCCAVCLLL